MAAQEPAPIVRRPPEIPVTITGFLFTEGQFAALMRGLQGERLSTPDDPDFIAAGAMAGVLWLHESALLTRECCLPSQDMDDHPPAEDI